MSALLALSDVVTLHALERSFSRGLSGDARSMAAQEGLPRHRAYQRFPVAASRHGHALSGAFDLLPELGWRWQLPVDASDWAVVLDRYCRDLLTSRADHSLDELETALKLLGAGHAA